MAGPYQKQIDALAVTGEERLLLAKTGDLLTRAGYSAVHTDFLNAGEQYLVRSFLKSCGLEETRDFLFFGGYPYAERRQLFLLPDGLAEALETDPDCDIRAALWSLCADTDSIGAVAVSGSGYRTLSHRDYLGSLLALGLERAVIGDIAVTDDAHAAVFVNTPMVSFLLSSLERIGADKVRIRALSREESEQIPDTRRTELLTDTVASVRLDAVVAVCTRLPREKAKQTVTSGLVELNFRPCTAPDTEVPEGASLSIRGFGRFLYEGTDGASKKGRLRVRLRRFL